MGGRGQQAHANAGIADTLGALTRATCVSRAQIGRDCIQLSQLTAITLRISMPPHACVIQARADWAPCARLNSQRNVKNERAQAHTIQSRSCFSRFSSAALTVLGYNTPIIKPPKSIGRLAKLSKKEASFYTRAPP